MSKMAELSYDIEQLWIEGKNPVEIASELDCHVQLVEDWIADQGLYMDNDQSERVFARIVEDLSPFETVNS